MTRYRYRTHVLIGPWRDSADHALLDAVGAKQAYFDEGQPSVIHWRVPGEIEELRVKRQGQGASG